VEQFIVRVYPDVRGFAILIEPANPAGNMDEEESSVCIPAILKMFRIKRLYGHHNLSLTTLWLVLSLHIAGVPPYERAFGALE
jgi:hypothetical protein